MRQWSEAYLVCSVRYWFVGGARTRLGPSRRLPRLFSALVVSIERRLLMFVFERFAAAAAA